MNDSLLIRADANAQMGTGHLMRCLALAQAWQARGGRAIFVTACDSESLLRRLRRERFQVFEFDATYPNHDDWRIMSHVLADHPDAWVVLDGYHFDPAYHRRVKEAGHPLLAIDDMAHLNHYHADVVLNQNIHAAQLDYLCEPYTRLLLGTDYVLLRREFRPWRDWQPEIPDVARKVLVTLGGGDLHNHTLEVVRSLQKVEVDRLEATVVVGASNPHYREVESAIRDSAFGIRLVHNVSDMSELMTWANVAVTAGGSTCWEIALLGLPSLLLTVADNQQDIAEGLDKAGVSIDLGWHEQVSRELVAKTLSRLISDQNQRQQMSQNGKELVDGQGAERVVSALVEV